MTLPPAVTNLITARRIEQVPADRASALVRLTRAAEKLEAARKIAAIDVEVAYVTTHGQRQRLHGSTCALEDRGGVAGRGLAVDIALDISAPGARR